VWGPSGGVVPVLLGGDLNCGPDSPCFAQFPHGGFVDLDTLPPHGPRLRFTMHVPLGTRAQAHRRAAVGGPGGHRQPPRAV
jgi:hypothetical protein